MTLNKIDSPIIVTADVDWASEYCIRQFIDTMLGFNIRPLMFVTHPSATIEEYAMSDLISVGIHPNFRSGSDHGKSVSDIIAFVCDLVDAAWISRSHGFEDTTEIQKCLIKKRVRIDSNELRFLEPNLTSWRLDTGMIRYPVFWSDGYEIRRPEYERWKVKSLEQKFSSNGLKIVNIHPFNWALNLNSVADYEKKKKYTKNIDKCNISIHKNVQKYGVADFVDNLFSQKKLSARVCSPEILKNV